MLKLGKTNLPKKWWKPHDFQVFFFWLNSPTNPIPHRPVAKVDLAVAISICIGVPRRTVETVGG